MAFPVVHNFNYYKGDTHQFLVDVKKQDNTNFRTSSMTYLFTIADKRGSSGIKVSGVVAPAAAPYTGLLMCSIIPSTGLSAGEYVYDVQITEPTTNPVQIYTVVTGTITVQEQVSGS